MRTINLITLFLILLTPEFLHARVPQIADPKLTDIAMVKADPDHGAVIIYNPFICQHIGIACHFFITHEYGHIEFSHQTMEGNYPPDRELQADCWAAANANPYATFAAYQLFMSGRSSLNWEAYGSPADRAEHVRECAIEAGNWVGIDMEES